MDKQAISFVMGKRLKELREERGLSHDKLIRQLNERYEISVSRDSVMAYEISDESRAKASKLPNMGMRVETLYCLADFYGVSLDYLLGKTDVIAINGDLAQAARYTGLPAASIGKLHELSTVPHAHCRSLIFVVDRILTDRADDFIVWAWRAAMAGCCPKIGLEMDELLKIRRDADMHLVEAANTKVSKTIEVPIDEYEQLCISTAANIIRESAYKALQDFKNKFSVAFQEEKSQK